MNILRRWKTILAGALLVAAGVVVGAVGAAGAIKKEFQARMDASTWSGRTTAWLVEAGGLTAAQTAAVRPAVDDAVAKLIDVRDSAEAERKRIVRRMFLEVLPKVDVAQRDKLKEAAGRAAEKPSAWSWEVKS